MNESDERRGKLRSDVCWPVNVLTDQGIIPGETINISADGISFSCEEAVPMEEIIKLSILPPDRSPIEISGKVAWADLCGIDEQNKAVGMGLCFIEISDEDRDFLIGAIAEAS